MRYSTQRTVEELAFIIFSSTLGMSNANLGKSGDSIANKGDLRLFCLNESC